MTQAVANKIFQKMASEREIRRFDFNPGYLFYNTNGLSDISDILIEYDLNNEEIEVKDLYDLAYEQMDNLDT